MIPGPCEKPPVEFTLVLRQYKMQQEQRDRLHSDILAANSFRARPVPKHITKTTKKPDSCLQKEEYLSDCHCEERITEKKVEHNKEMPKKV